MALIDTLAVAGTAVIGNGTLLSPTRAADVVAVLDAETYRQVFAGARPMDATVVERSDLMEHPLETGATIVDHRVLRPIEIDLPMRLVDADARDVYAEIRTLYLAGTLLIVQTRTGSYENMLIESIPHQEPPGGAVEMAIRLKEARFVTATFETLPARKVESKAQASTKKKGTAKTTKTKTASAGKAVATAKTAAPVKAATARKSSTLFDIFN